jgi:DNA-binding MarR family transcriptional regulator
MSALTTGLEKLKLLERTNDENDGRGVYFVATRKGRKILEEVEARMTEQFREILGPAAKSLTGLRSAAINAALDRQADREFGPSDEEPGS